MNPWSRTGLPPDQFESYFLGQQLLKHQHHVRVPVEGEVLDAAPDQGRVVTPADGALLLLQVLKLVSGEEHSLEFYLHCVIIAMSLVNP